MQQANAWGTRQRTIEWSVYALIAIVGVLPAVLAGQHVVGDGVDLYGTLWFFWWVRDCLEHLRSPGFTELFFYPLGKDIFAHTGNNFVDAYLSVPFQWIFGFPTWAADLHCGLALWERLDLSTISASRDRDRSRGLRGDRVVADLLVRLV